jgi:diguanylate cyclase (GGDEF)-like protein
LRRAVGDGSEVGVRRQRAVSTPTRPLRENLPLLFTRSLIGAFVLFLAIERLLGWIFDWVHLRWLSERWVEGWSALAVMAGAVVVTPRLAWMKEGGARAQREHDRFLAAAESSLDDFYIFDGVADASGEIVDFRFSYINPNAERRLQTQRENLMGKILTEVRPFMITSGLIDRYREVVRTGVPFSCEIFLDDERIKATWLNVQVVKLGDGIAITSRDVTERKRVDDHVHYLAHYDQLTGLPNRTLLQDRLRQALLRAQRYRHKVAVFMLDIDHFKRINDSLGHADGDALLRTVGQRLLALVRETDTIARMGGDEFVIVMPDFKSLEDVQRCGRQIVEAAAQPVRIGEREIEITVSVGLCIYPDSGLGLEDLLRNADSAMYVIKDKGRNGFHMFAEDRGEQLGSSEVQ